MNNSATTNLAITNRVRISQILVLALIAFAGLLTACGNDNVLPAEQEPEYAMQVALPEPPINILPVLPASGRITILTEPLGWGGVGWESYSANWLREIHGGEKIYHSTTWGGSRSSMELTAESIINDPEIRVVIINSARLGTNWFVSKIREQRSDIFIVYIDYESDGYCDYPYISQTFSEGVAMADLILNIDMFEMYRNLPLQAQLLGAETLVFFYISGWDDDSSWAESWYYYDEREAMRVASAEIGLRFVEVARSPWCIGCNSDFFMYKQENIPMLIDRYGRDIAFVGLGGPRMFAKSVREGVIYLPSYERSFPTSLALGMQEYALVSAGFITTNTEELSDKNNLPFIIDEIRTALDEHGMLGRVSTWPVSASTLLTYAAVEYGIKWINGYAPQNEIDIEILQQIMVDFIAKYSGEYGLGVNLAERVHDGNVYANYVLVFMEFMIY